MTGRKLYLRPIQREDMESFYQATQSEEIRYMTGTKEGISKEQVYQYFERISQDDSRVDLAICLLEGNVLLGDLSILDIDETNRKAGFRIALHHTDFLNKGYGTEAVEIALQYAFEKLALNRLQLEVYSHNKRGIKAYEKAGFKIEGTIRESIYLNGQYSDEIIMGMLYREYKELINETSLQI